jgi:hypothetical protein
MAEISVAAAVGEGFSIIRRRPMTVMGWGLLNVVSFGLIFALLAPVYMSAFGPAIQAAQAGAPPPDPHLMQAQIMRMQATSYLVDFASLLLASVLSCAAFRAVLHPERNRFAYIRVGAPELFLFVLILVGSVALGIGIVIAMIPFAIVIGILVAVHIAAAAVLVGVVGVIALLAALVYLALRLAFVGPMMVDDGKFHLGDAWTLSRGQVGGLFLTALVIFGMVIIAEVVVGLVFVALGAGALSVAAGGFSALPSLFRRPPQELLPAIGSVVAIAAVIWIPLMGCFVAITGAPWARAYRDVRPAADVSEAFV